MPTSKTSLFPLLIIVISNYIAQIPYGIHQYHGRYNLYGTFVLFVTLIWFLAGYFFIQKRKQFGFLLLFTFVLTQAVFYFMNEVVLSFYGYGMLYHYVYIKDWFLWLVFLVGDINFFAACFYCYYLVKNKKKFI